MAYAPCYDMQAFGARLREVRKQRGISVNQVADYLCLESVQAVYKWELGQTFPKLDNFFALLKLYGVNANEFMIEEERDSSSFFAINFTQTGNMCLIGNAAA